jgi:hypothetical protein
MLKYVSRGYFFWPINELLNSRSRKANYTLLGCLRNSVNTEFRTFFLLPYIPYAVRNSRKFRGSTRNSVSRNSKHFRGIPLKFAKFCLCNLKLKKKKCEIDRFRIFKIIVYHFLRNKLFLKGSFK